MNPVRKGGVFYWSSASQLVNIVQKLRVGCTHFQWHLAQTLNLFQGDYK